MMVTLLIAYQTTPPVDKTSQAAKHAGRGRSCRRAPQWRCDVTGDYLTPPDAQWGPISPPRPPQCPSLATDDSISLIPRPFGPSNLSRPHARKSFYACQFQRDPPPTTSMPHDAVRKEKTNPPEMPIATQQAEIPSPQPYQPKVTRSEECQRLAKGQVHRAQNQWNRHCTPGNLKKQRKAG